MRLVGRALTWLLLGLMLLPLVVFLGLIPVLGVEHASRTVGISVLFGVVALAERLTNVLYFFTSFDSGIPQSSILAIRSYLFPEDGCGNFTIERLPEDAPHVPETWTPPDQSNWRPTPAMMSHQLASCDLDPDIRAALKVAQSQPGSYVLNSFDSFHEARLYSGPLRIAAKVAWGD